MNRTILTGYWNRFSVTLVQIFFYYNFLFHLPERRLQWKQKKQLFALKLIIMSKQGKKVHIRSSHGEKKHTKEFTEWKIFFQRAFVWAIIKLCTRCGSRIYHSINLLYFSSFSLLFFCPCRSFEFSPFFFFFLNLLLSNFYLI